MNIGNGRLIQFILNDNNFEGTFPGGWNPKTMLEAVEIQGNNFDAIDPYVCKMSVWMPGEGELTSLRTDCSICTCGYPLCQTIRCAYDL